MKLLGCAAIYGAFLAASALLMNRRKRYVAQLECFRLIVSDVAGKLKWAPCELADMLTYYINEDYAPFNRVFERLLEYIRLGELSLHDIGIKAFSEESELIKPDASENIYCEFTDSFCLEERLQIQNRLELLRAKLDEKINNLNTEKKDKTALAARLIRLAGIAVVILII